MTTPLWVVNTRLKLQGANFHTDEHKEAKVPRYRGILGNLDNINWTKRNHLTYLMSQNSLLLVRNLLKICDNAFDIFIFTENCSNLFSFDKLKPPGWFILTFEKIVFSLVKHNGMSVKGVEFLKWVDWVLVNVPLTQTHRDAQCIPMWQIWESPLDGGLSGSISLTVDNCG